MHLAVYFPLLAPILAAVSARWLATRLEPRVATCLLTGAAVILAAASGAALTALAATAVGQVPWLAEFGHWSVEVLRRDDPASLYLALVAGMVLTVAVAAAVRLLRRRIAAIVAAARTARCLPGPGQMVVLDDVAPDAYALPGWPGRIVVSTGMLDALDVRERHVVVAHERAHLAGGHHLFIALADLAAATNPLLRPLATAVRYSIERWADEDAARAVGDRTLTARTIGKAALLTRHSRRSRAAAAMAITPTAQRRRWRALPWADRLGPVPRRVVALLNPPVGHRALLPAVTVAFVVITCAASVEAARDLHALFLLARAATT